MTIDDTPIQRHRIDISPDGEHLGTYLDPGGRYVLYTDHCERMGQILQMLDEAQLTTKLAIKSYRELLTKVQE